MEKQTSSRIPWLDFARSFAIITVVLCHAIETIYKLNVDYLYSVSSISRIFAISAFTLARLGVPFFLFMSGYLFLDKEYSTSSCIRFWKTKWLPLLCSVEIWIALYNVFLYFFEARTFTVETLLSHLFFLDKVKMSHIWYMPMIIGMYVFFPFVANALRKINTKLLYVPLAIIFMYACVIPIINVVLVANEHEPLSFLFSLGFSGGAYGIYLILGYMQKKEAFKNIPLGALLSVGCFFFAATILLQLYSYHKGVKYNVWYDCGFLLIASLCFFECFARFKVHTCPKLIAIIAKYSFAIYLIHNPVRMILAPYIKALSLMLPLKVGLLWLISLLISLLIATIIYRIPKVGKFILYMK